MNFTIVPPPEHIYFIMNHFSVLFNANIKGKTGKQKNGEII
jgi:hypothetical protein